MTPMWTTLRGLEGLVGLEERASDLRFLSEDEGRRAGEELRAHYERMPMGTLWPGKTFEQARAASRSKVQVIAGPSYGRPWFPGGPPLEGAWYVDPDAPTQLFFALASDVAPLLWVACRPDADEVLAIAAGARPSDAPRSQRFRAVMGHAREIAVPDVYSGQLVEVEPATLTNYWNFNPYRVNTPLPGGPSTRFSQSLARCEYHVNAQLFVWDVEYAPAALDGPIRALNESFGIDLPLDLPLDVVGCLLGFATEAEPFVRKSLEAVAADDGPAIAYWLSRLAALRYAQPDVRELLAAYADHPDRGVRFTVAVSAVDAGLRELFLSLRDREPDPELRSWLEGDEPPSTPQVMKHAIG